MVTANVSQKQRFEDRGSSTIPCLVAHSCKLFVTNRGLRGCLGALLIGRSRTGLGKLPHGRSRLVEKPTRVSFLLPSHRQVIGLVIKVSSNLYQFAAKIRNQLH